MKTLKILVLVLTFSYSFGQDTTLYLHSWKKPKKIFKVGTDCYIEVELKKVDSVGKARPTFYRGRLVSVWPEKIIVRIEHEKLEKKTADGLVISSLNFYSFEKDPFVIAYNEYLDKKRISEKSDKHTTYRSFSDSVRILIPENIKAINIKTIDLISFPKLRGKKNPGNERAPIWAVGLIGALIVAPLRSIDFNTGNFDQNIYYSWLSVCGTAFAVGIPISIFFDKERHCKIKTHAPLSDDRNYYSMQTK